MTTFEHPEYVFFLAGIPGLLLLYAGWRFWRRRALARLADAHLAEKMMPAPFYPSVRIALWVAAMALLILAWANPTGSAVQKTDFQGAADVIIALDVSASMLAADLSPNRLELARLFARQLVEALPGSRVGLIFFAGEASLRMPLSTDIQAAKMLLRTADPAYAGAQGTDLAQAIAVAQRSLRAAPGGGGRALVLITDGEDHEGGAESVAKAAYKEGMVLFAVGAGTPQGAPVPEGPGGFKHDEQGNPVVSRVNMALLEKLARAGGGKSFALAQGQTALQNLLYELQHLDQRATTVVSISEKKSGYQWLLLPGLLALLLYAALPKYRKS